MDGFITLHPYFNVHEGKIDEFKAITQKFIEATTKESGVIFYGFSFSGNLAFCREGYVNGEALLAHMSNVSGPLSEALKISDVARLEVHASETELAKVRDALAGLNPTIFVYESGFRRPL
jgi:hypothetical protein